MLRRTPSFSALAVTILAAGIAATTVMYSLVHQVLLRDLPFEESGRLVWMYNTRTERDRAPLSVPDLEDYRRQATTIADFAPFTNWSANLTGTGAPERLDGVRVSGRFFPVLGTEAAVGRLLQPEDEARQAPVVVLSHGLWQRRFAGDRAVIGQAIVLNGVAHSVVGVLPPRFLFPFREADVAAPLSLATDPRRLARGFNFLRVVARLRDGVDLRAAKAELDAIARQLQARYPVEDGRKIGISLYPLHAEIVRDYRGMLWALLGSVSLLLIVACVNLATLQLVRAAGRRRELTLRSWLGASRVRIACDLLSEALLLSLVGGALGVVVAHEGLRGWRAWGPADFPHLAQVALDRPAVAFALAMSIATAAICGVVPAWFASRAGAGETGRATASSGGSRIQRAFVATQIAVAVVILVGMLLMARGLARLERVAPGFTPGPALSLQLSLPPATYANRDALVEFYEALRDRLDETGNVDAAGVVSLLPLSRLLSTADVAFPDRPPPPPDRVPQAHLRVASSEYFTAAGIPLIQGRAFTRHDRQDSLPVAIVSRTFAARHWPGEPAVGKQVRIVQTPPAPPLEVVGVVSDVKQFTLDAPATADLYLPLHQMPAFQVPLVAARMYWVVRGRDTATPDARLLREAVVQIDSGVAASSARTLESVWSASLGSQRANVRLLEVFGNVALALCAIGTYGVAAVATRSRRRELAIRSALGATRHGLILALLRGELAAVVLGLLCGFVGALGAAPVLFVDAFETSPRDATTFGEVGLLMLIVTALAAYVPVWRAGTANPRDVLSE